MSDAHLKSRSLAPGQIDWLAASSSATSTVPPTSSATERSKTSSPNTTSTRHSCTNSASTTKYYTTKSTTARSHWSKRARGKSWKVSLLEGKCRDCVRAVAYRADGCLETSGTIHRELTAACVDNRFQVGTVRHSTYVNRKTAYHLWPSEPMALMTRFQYVLLSSCTHEIRKHQ